MKNNIARKAATGFCCALLTAGVTSMAVAQNTDNDGYIERRAALSDPAATTLDGVLTDVINANPQVLASWEALQAAMDEVGVARGGYYPSIDVLGGVGYQSREGDDRGAYQTEFAQISLTQMLYDGFYTANEVNRLGHAKLTRYYELLSNAQEVSLEAVRAYLGVRRYRELVELARNNYAAHLEVYNQIEERVQAGAGPQSNLEQITGRLALAESNLLTEGSNLHDASARYQRVTGHLPPENLTPVPDQLDAGIPPTVSATVDRALENNPSFHAAIENIFAAEALEESTMAAFKPKLELQARAGSNNDNTFLGRRDERAVELVVSMNLFRGGSDLAEHNRAEDLVTEAKYVRDQECVDIRQTTTVAYNDTRKIAEQMAYLRQHAASVGRVLSAYRQQFDIGQRSLLDVLDSENEYFEARRAYANAQYDLKLAYARTHTSMGNLLQTVGVQREGMPTLVELGGREIDLEGQNLCPAVGADSYTLADLTEGTAPELPAEPQKAPDFIMPNDTLFEKNEHYLTVAAQQNLREALERIRETDNLQRIFIAGHADTTGNDAINDPLSARRARSVAEFLVSRGVDPALITTRGYGSHRPAHSNATREGREANRRVEITLEQVGEYAE